MSKITVNIDEKESRILEKRAKKNLMTLREQVEDIIRRSCVNATLTSSPEPDCDDKLVSIFSRKRKANKKAK